jgi:hypothetical protein
MWLTLSKFGVKRALLWLSDNPLEEKIHALWAICQDLALENGDFREHLTTLTLPRGCQYDLGR